MIFRAVVFTFIPTAIELVLVSWLLARSFSPQVAALVLATFALYVGWTTIMTKVSKVAMWVVGGLGWGFCTYLDSQSWWKVGQMGNMLEGYSAVIKSGDARYVHQKHSITRCHLIRHQKRYVYQKYPITGRHLIPVPSYC